MPRDLAGKIIADLRAKRLPQMVDWIDPGLLVRIGIRDVISGTIGQYADQRLMQAASDKVESELELVQRYDYSNLTPEDPDKRVKLDADGAVWVDYIADLGDGFEATFAMASLMAPETLQVRASGSDETRLTLQAGQILVMGGDQAYPQATAEEYEKRLINPYNWAFRTNEPQRKLFAIPGNHDWYDGLGAFTSLFTAARSRISGGLGQQIGGWRSVQHRSYFALKLPYDWWIWGPDIQLEGNLDDPQRDYFDIIADYTKPGDKIILCLAEPSWLHENYDNLHEINLMARKRGAKVCAVLAGDWHHYSRYANDELGVALVTCGGGGAFAHATHQLRKTIELQWAVGSIDEHRDDSGRPNEASGDAPGFAVPPEKVSSAAYATQAAQGAGFYPRPRSLSAGVPAGVAAASASDQDQRYRKFKAKFAKRKPQRISKRAVRRKAFVCEAKAIYPSRAKSRMLSLKNLLLPFHNRSFALFVGAIYFLYAWVFQTSAPEIDKALLQMPQIDPSADATQKAASALNMLSTAFWATIAPARVVEAATNNPVFFFMLIGLWGGLIYYVDLGKGFLNTLGKIALGSAHFFAHLATLLVVNLFAFLPGFVLAGLPVLIVSSLGVSGSYADLAKNLSFLLTYSAVSILLGGLLGAFVMGVYWTVTSSLFAMHCGDAFGALGIPHYKNFLRMKFEPDQLTIYPVAIDKVPGRKGWRAARGTEGGSNNAVIVPDVPLDPHLIEPPIVVRAQDLPMNLQRVE